MLILGSADEEHPEQAPVGDRAAAGHREPLRSGTAGQRAADAVPHQPGPQLGELVGRVAPGQHVEHRLEGRPREGGVGSGPAHHVVHHLDVPLVDADHRDDLLREHVERVARVAHRLDRAVAHPLGDHSGLHEVAAELGEDDALGHRADLVPRPADALQPARHRRRRLDLDHQVDRTHVDAQLERRGRDDRGQPPGLERLLDLGALLLGHRAVVSTRDLGDRPGLGSAGRRPGLRHDLRRLQRPGLGQRLAGGALVVDLVEAGAQPLGEPARVGEHDGRAVGRDEVDDALLDVRPDGRTSLLAGCGPADLARGLPELAEVLDRDDDLELDGLAGRRLHDLDVVRAAEEARDLLHRAHGGGQADALRGPVEQVVQALQRDRQVGAALGAGDGVDLVDDHRLDAAQRLARLRGQHAGTATRGS